ncbi:hypothetical protein SNOUR_17600 [Streptomyces noursei ATCC 11455]|uniref:hypothetical protein n=1 Tax=Streptomyces noursei TaxID=1971 RepID=UPI00081C4922|nr:hypothetical protein SNOUR_17600 [Streptomyces noursei ATCC 11455]
MTQSGQGNDPQNSAAGPAREGIVLPAVGGDAWAPDQQAAPPAGRPWGQPWGPGQQPAAQPGGAPGGPQPYDQGPAQGYPAAPPAHAPAPQAPPLSAPLEWEVPPSPFPQPGGQQLPPQNPGFPQQPQEQPQTPPMPGAPPALPPQAGPPAAGPLPPHAAGADATTILSLGGQSGRQSVPGALPPQNAPYAGRQPAPAGELVRATPQAGAPLPPAAGDAEATTLLPPVAGGPGAAPLPPEASAAAEPRDAATQMLRAIKPTDAPPRGGQPLPGSADGSEATQLIPPVGGGAPGVGMPTPPPGTPFGAGPGVPGERPTPAEFDGLFRDGPAGPGASAAPDSTAQLPRFDSQAAHPPYGQQGGPGGPFAPGGGQGQYASYEEDGGGRRKIPAAAIVGVIVVALAGVGLGVGWALSGGSDDDAGPKKQDTGTTKAKTAGGDASKSADDPAASQAKGLDALLADSNNSRSAVIGAVQNIKGCNNLDGAAGDLRSAAGQRNDLVKRLQQLPVDKLPNSGELTAALTKAWQSSAAADNHYAAWADKAAGKGGCDKGHAKGGKEAGQGNAASGAATQAKRQAAGLWNPIAQKYGLREHQPEQL